MARFQRWHLSISALAIAGLLSACGGGGSGDTSNPTVPVTPSVSVKEQAAIDGFKLFNLRRSQVGIATPLTRNSLLDLAAQRHSTYQTFNDITHVQFRGKTGFTGVEMTDRFAQAGYTLTGPYIFGEVIAKDSNTSGTYLAEALIAAIYHRFLIFEPVFKEAGIGADIAASGAIYFTANFGANNGYGPGIGSGKIVNYPYANQTNVPANFFSDNESPDPVPGINNVGYPISVHADASATVKVGSFTVQRRGGNPLATQLLTETSDAMRETPASAAAIIPLEVLLPNTIYDVLFIGTVNGVGVTQSWSFTTQ